MTELLRSSKDVLAWVDEYMPRIDPVVASHKLIVNLDMRPTKRKKKHFNLERYQAIGEEV